MPSPFSFTNDVSKRLIESMTFLITLFWLTSNINCSNWNWTICHLTQLIGSLEVVMKWSPVAIGNSLLGQHHSFQMEVLHTSQLLICQLESLTIESDHMELCSHFADKLHSEWWAIQTYFVQSVWNSMVNHFDIDLSNALIFLYQLFDDKIAPYLTSYIIRCWLYSIFCH